MCDGVGVRFVCVCDLRPGAVSGYVTGRRGMPPPGTVASVVVAVGIVYKPLRTHHLPDSSEAATGGRTTRWVNAARRTAAVAVIFIICGRRCKQDGRRGGGCEFVYWMGDRSGGGFQYFMTRWEGFVLVLLWLK